MRAADWAKKTSKSRCSAVGAEVMEARPNIFEKLHVRDGIQVNLGHYVDNSPLDVLFLHEVTGLEKRLVDLLNVHCLLVGQMPELLQDPHHHVFPLGNNIAENAASLPHCASLLPLHDLVVGAICIAVFIARVNRRLRLQHAHWEVLIKHLVAELVIANLAVPSHVEVLQELDHKLLRHVGKAKLFQGLTELAHCDNTIMVHVETAEDVPDQRELLTHRLTELLEHRLYLIGLVVGTRIIEQLPCVLIHIKHLKLVVVHLDNIARH
mmetsp:Transcript_142733/g.355796  ORF Transcript_142733/g.355796 Transcript_142733/m.355796 type:complete len:266 (+) Transcript_142733:77-874(+)